MTAIISSWFGRSSVPEWFAGGTHCSIMCGNSARPAASSCLLAKYAPHATRRGSAECSHAPIWVESATVEMEICCPFAADKSDAAKMSAMEMRWNIIYEIPSQQDYFSHSRQS